MSSIVLKNLCKTYQQPNKKKDLVYAVKDFSLEINSKEFVVFVGPSGCGKSTTLRMIAGLEDITSGSLFIDGVYMNDTAPKNRNISMVFQNYALYPHMNAYDNIAFPLKIKKTEKVIKDKNGETLYVVDERALNKQKSIKKKLVEALNYYKKTNDEAKAKQFEFEINAIDKEIKKLEEKRASDLDTFFKYKVLYEKKCKGHLLQEEIKEYEAYKKHLIPKTKLFHYSSQEIDAMVHDAAKVLDIEWLLKRKPREMSGGQRQRVALGRAIVRSPSVFLFDEPLSNLDAKLRANMRSEIVSLYKKLNSPFIYVTHDQIEAMTMGTKIVVMKDGIIQQIGTPDEVFSHPKNTFVAGFIGTPQMNMFKASMKKEKDHIEFVLEDGQTFKESFSKLKPFKKEYLDGKTHSIVLGVRGEHIKVSKKGIKVNVQNLEYLGTQSHVLFSLGNDGVTKTLISLDRFDQLPDTINIEFEADKLYFFDSNNEQNISEE